MQKHRTSNIEHPTSNVISGSSDDFDVRCSEWLLLNSGPGSAAFNMAFDEALLEAMPRLGKPVLRFYGWTQPAASFGYFQKHAEVERATPLRPLVRRPTGGGIVPHDADWTYSLAFPPDHEWYLRVAIESYRSVHQWVASAFTRLGIPAELAPGCRKAGPGQCFAGHEKFDVLWHGQKIAGAAQRRTRAGLLVQGSIQPPPAVARDNWQTEMRRVARETFGMSWKAFTPDEFLRERAETLAAQKYSQPSHNQRR